MARLAFMGSPDFAAPALLALHGAGHEIAAVYCQPPRPAGRGQTVRRCPVHEAAAAIGLEVRTPVRLRRDEAAQAAFAALGLDVAVVAAYGLILPQAMLDAPTRGCLNIHASLLPRWRGAAPIQAALLAGDGETGITIMQMDAGLDTGAMLARDRVPIGATTTAGELHDALMPAGAELMGQALARLDAEGLSFTPQAAEGVVYAHKITNEEAHIDWSRPAAEVARHVNGLSPFPGAYFEADLGKGVERVKVLRALTADGFSAVPGTLLDAACTVACGTGAVRLRELRRAGKGGTASGEEFLRGARLAAGASFA